MRKISAALSIICLTIGTIPLTAQSNRVIIDFGDDSGLYADDGDCDDPRFEGRKMGEGLLTDNIGRDASDCRALFRQGRVTLSPLFAPLTDPADINYGDDDGEYANDGECDDIRFTRPDASEVLYMADDIGHDATDCRTAVEAGLSQWQGNSIRMEQQYMFQEEMSE